MRRGETRRVKRIKYCWIVDCRNVGGHGVWVLFFSFRFLPLLPCTALKSCSLCLSIFFAFLFFFFCFFGKHNCRRNISYTTYCVCGGVCVCVYLSNVRVCVSVVLAASAAINYNRASWICRCCCCRCLSCCWCCCSCCLNFCCCCRVVGQLNLNLTLCMSNSAEASLCCTPCNSSKQQIAACSLQIHLYLLPSVHLPMRCDVWPI